MALLYFFENIRTPILNIAAIIFSLLGEEIVFLCALGVIFWCFSKKTARKLFFAYITASSVLNIINLSVHDPLPWVRDPGFSTLNIVRDNVYGYTFPSNGIFNTVFLSAGIFTNFKEIIAKLSAVLAVVLAVISYFYLGMCTIWGAVAAILIAAFAVIVFNAFIDGMLFDRAQYMMYGLIQMIPVFILVIVSLSLYFNEVTDIAATSRTINRCGIYLGLLVAWYVEDRYIGFSTRCDRLWKQLVKACIGVSIMLILYIGLTLLFSLIPGFHFGGFLRNLITTAAGFGAFPILIRRFFQPVYR